MSKLYGVGVNDMKGISTSSVVKDAKIYRIWYDMLLRCYSSKFHNSHPTYVGCKVCSRWHTLSNFYHDVQYLPGYDAWKANGFKGYALDKDSIFSGNKIYSPSTCCIITKSDNSLERVNRCGNSFKNPGRPVIAIAPDGTISRHEGTSPAGKALGIAPTYIHRACVMHSGSHTVKRGKFKGWSFYWEDEYFV